MSENEARALVEVVAKAIAGEWWCNDEVTQRDYLRQADKALAVARQHFAQERDALRAEIEGYVSEREMIASEAYQSGYESAVEETRTELATAREALGQAAVDVLAERKRQQLIEGWTPDHDDEHADEELADAAAAYALSPKHYVFPNRAECPDFWPWDERCWNPKDDRRRDLVRAGALILAEIERLDRAERS